MDASKALRYFGVFHPPPLSMKHSCPHIGLPLLAVTGFLSPGSLNSNFRLSKQNSLYLKRLPHFTYHHFHSYFSFLPSMLEYLSMQHTPSSTLCVFPPRSSSANALFRGKGKKKKKKFCKLSYILVHWPSSDQFHVLEAIKYSLKETSMGDLMSYK